MITYGLLAAGFGVVVLIAALIWHGSFGSRDVTSETATAPAGSAISAILIIIGVLLLLYGAALIFISWWRGKYAEGEKPIPKSITGEQPDKSLQVPIAPNPEKDQADNNSGTNAS